MNDPKMSKGEYVAVQTVMIQMSPTILNLNFEKFIEQTDHAIAEATPHLSQANRDATIPSLEALRDLAKAFLAVKLQIPKVTKIVAETQERRKAAFEEFKAKAAAAAHSNDSFKAQENG